jgi:hypothetical protein
MFTVMKSRDHETITPGKIWQKPQLTEAPMSDTAFSGGIGADADDQSS